MLEVDALPVRHLRQLIELVGQVRVERELNVHRTTVRRWLSGQVKAPGHQHHVIKMLLGDLPGGGGGPACQLASCFVGGRVAQVGDSGAGGEQGAWYERGHLPSFK